MDPIGQFKESQKKLWAGFAPMESHTGVAAPHLVRFAGVEADQHVLDVGCGTGVVALTAARTGATVTGLDLTPELIERARHNGEVMGLAVDWHLGDVEDLPFTDNTFDVVLSQFAHMFAPRPAVAVSEMLRVLRPGGTIAFSTWPMDGYTALMFRVNAEYAPPPPEGSSPPWEWGDEGIIRERLGDAVAGVSFRREVRDLPMLSPYHGREFFETNTAPVTRIIGMLEDDPPRLAAYRAEVEDLISRFFTDNNLRQEFLMTRATKI